MRDNRKKIDREREGRKEGEKERRERQSDRECSYYVQRKRGDAFFFARAIFRIDRIETLMKKKKTLRIKRKAVGASERALAAPLALGDKRREGGDLLSVKKRLNF